MKNKIFLTITTIIFVCALVLALFNIKDFSFIANMRKASLIEFDNPIQQFYEITNLFNINGKQDWWQVVLNYISGIWQIMWIPVNIIKIILVDLVKGMQYVLTILGLL